MGDLVSAARDLEAFLSEWYGPPSTPPLPIDSPVPPALRRWYACAAAWRPQRLTHQNSVRAVDDLTVEDGATVFYDENQHCCHWAYGPGDDPAVFLDGWPSGPRWQVVGEVLSTFLTHVAVFEASLSGPAVRSIGDGSKRLVHRCLDMLEPAPFVPWQWPSPDSRLYVGEGVVAQSGPNVARGEHASKDSNWYLFIAGKSELCLARFDESGLNWDWESQTGWLR